MDDQEERERERRWHHTIADYSSLSPRALCHPHVCELMSITLPSFLMYDGLLGGLFVTGISILLIEGLGLNWDDKAYQVNCCKAMAVVGLKWGGRHGQVLVEKGGLVSLEHCLMHHDQSIEVIKAVLDAIIAICQSTSNGKAVSIIRGKLVFFWGGESSFWYSS